MNNSVFPTMAHDPQVGSILDNLGIKPGSSVPFSALPVRGLNLIWNEYYRDQDLQTELAIHRGSGLDTTTTIPEYLNVAWEKDYFTTSRPWEQKGPDVTLPLGTTASGTATILTGGAASGGSLFNLVRGEADTGGQASVDLLTGTMATGTPLRLIGDVDVDLSTATAATVNDLRLALALQRYEEARARFGSRYTEYLRYLGAS